MGFLFQTTFFHSGNLVPSPVRRGKVRMGVASWLEGKSNWCSPQSHPLPSPLPPDGRGGQAARRGIDFCPATVIPAPAYARTGYDVNLPLNLGNCFSNISFLEFPMDSRLRGNDVSGVFGVVYS